MNSKPFVCGAIAVLLFASANNFLAQEGKDADGARSAFLESRKKKPAPVRRPKAGGRPSSQADRPSRPGKGYSNLVNAIGVGYTIYRRRNYEDPVTVSPSTIFYHGDAIRIVLEPNTDGYLYVFHTENGQRAEMIFPDARLNGGVNRISAHVPYEVPSSKESDARFRWFYFDTMPATERLYIVVTRNPLYGVPTAGELVSYCRTYSRRCPWRPVSDVWELIKRSLDAPVRASVREEFNEEQASVEREAIDRGLGLPKGAPQPSVVRVSVSPGAVLLVTMVELIHR